MLLISSLERLTRFLFNHYGKKVILLIDEYDSPIESAYEKKVYDEVYPESEETEDNNAPFELYRDDQKYENEEDETNIDDSSNDLNNIF